METIRGFVRNGIVQPSSPIEGCEGRTVLITILDEWTPLRGDSPDESSGAKSERARAESWNGLMNLIGENQVETGIKDLAHQHDHYVHGLLKKPPL